MNFRISRPLEDEHERREGVAYHEAGHCVLAWHLNVKLFCAAATADEDAIANGISDGFTHGSFLKWDIGDEALPPWGAAREEILIALAGPLAAAKHGGFTRFSSWLNGGRSDYRRAQDISLRYFRPERARQLLDEELRREAKRLLSLYWPVVRVVAERLMRGGRVEGDELKDLMDQAAIKYELPSRAKGSSGKAVVASSQRRITR